MIEPQILYDVTFAGVMICWIGFAAAFLLRKRSITGGEKRGDKRAFLGIALEAGGYSMVWMFRRSNPLLVDAGGIALAAIFSAAALLLAACSVWLVMSAVRKLGKQWAVAARVLEDHQLVTDGPYSIVRNPIYTGMFGMLIATGLAVSQWWALLAACPLFWYGTVVRVKVEEQLLRETFGEDFEAYAKRTPALLPRLMN